MYVEHLRRKVYFFDAAVPDPMRWHRANRVRWGTKQLYAMIQVL